MNVKEIISLIPDSILEDLALETNVNKYSKKLKGEVIFKLLLHCILSYKDNSLRRMESNFESIIFTYWNKKNDDAKSIRFSSISERLKTMNPLYFQNLFSKCIEIYSSYFEKKNQNLIRYDSTIVSLSTKLLHVGYNLKNGDAANLNLVKYSIGLSEIPTIAHIYTEQSSTSENRSLGKTILEHETKDKQIIRIFDRGVNARNTYDELIDKHIPFISRTNVNCKHKIIEKSTISPIQTSTLNILSDEKVYLYSEKSIARHPIRLIKATQQNAGNDPIWFISSMDDLTAPEICELYKRRWDIEVFFKFLKQELNFSHFVNRSRNGIEIILYATLIASILLLVYKKTNDIKGYKIMKQRFLHELEWEIMKEIVIICNGDISKLEKLRQKPPD